MILSPTRRRLIAGTSVLLAVRAATAFACEAAPIAAIEARHGGRLGVFVLDTGSGRTLAHRADERFLLCSTFKGVLAALVLSRVDAGRDNLANGVPYGERDLLPPSPVTGAHVREGTLTVGALCEAILLVSDNAAANLLLARVGGPPALTAFARTLGDAVTRFDRYEFAAGTRSRSRDTRRRAPSRGPRGRSCWATCWLPRRVRGWRAGWWRARWAGPACAPRSRRRG